MCLMIRGGLPSCSISARLLCVCLWALNPISTGDVNGRTRAHGDGAQAGNLAEHPRAVPSGHLGDAVPQKGRSGTPADVTFQRPGGAVYISAPGGLLFPGSAGSAVACFCSHVRLPWGRSWKSGPFTLV